MKWEDFPVKRTIKDIHPGEKETLSKTITESDVFLYIGITGDLNPLFLDHHYARATRFKGTIVPGVLTAGLVMAAIDMKLPGPGTITVWQDFEFISPVRVGDTITTRLEVIKVIKSKNQVLIKSVCHNQDDQVVLEGHSMVKPPPAALFKEGKNAA